MGFLKNLWGKAKEGGKKLLGKAKGKLTDAGKALWGKAKEAGGRLWGNVKQKGIGLLNDALDGNFSMDKLKQAGEDLLGDAKSEGKNFLNQDVVGQLKSMLG